MTPHVIISVVDTASVGDVVSIDPRPVRTVCLTCAQSSGQLGPCREDLKALAATRDEVLALVACLTRNFPATLAAPTPALKAALNDAATKTFQAQRLAGEAVNDAEMRAAVRLTLQACAVYSDFVDEVREHWVEESRLANTVLQRAHRI